MNVHNLTQGKDMALGINQSRKAINWEALTVIKDDLKLSGGHKVGKIWIGPF